jgi:hypothetical protein
MIMEQLLAAVGVSALAALLGPLALVVHLVLCSARSPRRPERAVLLLGTAFGALGAATLIFTLLIVGIGLGRSDAPDSSIPDSVTRGVLAGTYGPAVVIVAGAVLAAIRRMTITARLLAVAPLLPVVLLVVIYLGASLLGQ